MKRLIALIVAAVMCTVGFIGCTSQKELVIGYTEYPPMNYFENDKLVGFDTEFAEAVCAKLGYKAKFQLIDWNSKYVELNGGTIDCIWNGFTYNSTDDDGVERSEKVDFTYAYMNNKQCVVVKKDALATLSSKDALAGKKVAAEDGSAGEGIAKELIGDNGTYVGATAQMNTLTELSSGNVDFVVIDKTMADSIIGKGDYADLAIAEGVEIEGEQYAVGFKKGSELTDKVNQAIKELAADGTLARLAEKYGLSNYLITEY